MRCRAVHRKGGNTEAGRDVLVAQQRIGSNPAAQLARKLARLLHRCFRHQDHEFVTAVPRHHIRTAAILLENMAHALQHHVAFQVPVEVVYKLEAVQVHQHE